MHPEQRGPTILFVTYTMVNPRVGGAFFRALRLAAELQRRGWSPIICNKGPILDDPKMRQAEGRMRIEQVGDELEADSREAYRFFQSLQPEIVVFGEGPFEAMRVLYEGAKMVKAPFVVLDQYYMPMLHQPVPDVDLQILYGLRSFWRDELQLDSRSVMVPPFIEAVTPRTELPVPADLQHKAWVTLIGYESSLVKQGIELLSRLHEPNMAVICVSRDPSRDRQLLSAADTQWATCLPLQSDANVFGLTSASQAAIISNGFLQIMEALALTCPVVCLDRGGTGIEAWTVDARFRPFVSIGEDAAQQLDRLRQWLAASPFVPALRNALHTERRGTIMTADLVESVARRRWIADPLPRSRRWAQRALAHLPVRTVHSAAS